MSVPCFSECECSCVGFEHHSSFDAALRAETQWGDSPQDIISSHAGWYTEPTEDGAPWEVASFTGSGVYILWRQDGWCEPHQMEHLQALYVGRSGSDIASRLREHRRKKCIGAGMTVEISIAQQSRRKAKYLEQLLLDYFNFPLNHAENPGTQRLCHHIAPGEWN